MLGPVRVGDAYLRYNSGLDVYVGSARALSASTTGGTMHGVWSSDGTITTSDRRLKKDILPLEEALEPLMRAHGDEGDRGAAWLLRELRPVAYRFKRGSEAKYQRFGFIADEVAGLVPDLARALPGEQLGGKDGGKDAEPVSGLVYSDLIAVLVAQVQKQEERITRLERARPADRLKALEEAVARIALQVAELTSRCPGAPTPAP